MKFFRKVSAGIRPQVVKIGALLTFALVLALTFSTQLVAHAQATQVPFGDVVSGSTDFSNGYGNYIVAAIIITLGLMVVARLMGRRR